MRIRSIRPEFWTSEDVAVMDWHTRLVYIGLWSYVDDNGVGRDLEQLIVASLFPLDEDLTESSVRVHGALKRLETGGQVTRYRVDGRPYLHVTSWFKHQKINRASEGRYPLPTSADTKPHPSLTEHSLSPQPEPPLGEGEKGRRGEVTTPSTQARTTQTDTPTQPAADPGPSATLTLVEPPQPTPGPSATDTQAAKRAAAAKQAAADTRSRFAEFWQTYPRKEGKGGARRAWTRALKTATADAIITGIENQREKYAAKETQFIPLPATWLNDSRWEDEHTHRPTPRKLDSWATGPRFRDDD